MGRMYAVLDPDGYYYASEPGWHYEWAAGKLLQQWREQRTDDRFKAHKFLNLPGSDWLLPRPRQMNADWYADARLDLHVIPEADWNFDPLISVKEWEATRKGNGTTYPKNKWVTIAEVPAGVSDMSGVVYANVGAAAGVTLPASMATIGFCGTTPAGVVMQSGEYHPYVQFIRYPEPEPPLLFGFGQYCCILYRDLFALLVNRNLDESTWELLGKWKMGTAEKTLDRRGGEAWGMNFHEAHQFKAEVRSFMVIPTGPHHFYLYFASGDPVSVQVKSAAEPMPLISPDSWWLAAATGAKISMQAQVVGYEVADSSVEFDTPNVTTVFDLGETYRPTEDPEVYVQGGVHTIDGGLYGFNTGAGATVVSSPNSFQATSNSSGDDVLVQLRNKLGGAWVSDGTVNEGNIRVRLTPGNQGTNAGYLAPALRVIDLRFPPKHEPRVTNTLILDDTQFKGWKVSASLREPDGKRFQLDLWEDQVDLLFSNGFDKREGYPIHIVEDLDNDGVLEPTDPIRVAAWVESPDLEELKTESGASAAAVRFYRLAARGLLSRLEEPWLYLPQMVNPSTPGFVEHTWAIGETLFQRGFDTLDSTKVHIDPDPHAGTAIARLPGTWGDQFDGIRLKIDGAWAPTWDEERLEYARRVAHDWRRWLFYEDLSGKVWYHPDAMLVVMLGGAYVSQFTLYRSQAEATGAGRTGQYMLADSPPKKTIVPAAGNIVRVTGKDSDGRLTPHIIDSDSRSISDDTYEHFIGDTRVVPLVNRFAVNERAMRILARGRLLQAVRRRDLRSFDVPLAPWQFGAGTCELGYSATFQGRSDRQIAHLEVEQLARAVFRTRLTAELLPGQ